MFSCATGTICSGRYVISPTNLPLSVSPGKKSEFCKSLTQNLLYDTNESEWIKQWTRVDAIMWHSDLFLMSEASITEDVGNIGG